MKIVVCLKQVPFVDQLKFDYDNKRLIREGVGGEINPFDKRAIAQAIALRQQFGGEVIVVTMGPPQAKEALVEALAMGCDRAVHLLGREFAGADTLATARALAFACQKIGYDLIFCGRYSTDAETAQVPPMLAEMLDLPQVTGATELKFSDDGRRLTVKRELDDGFEIVETSLPVVLSAAERLAKPIKVKPEDLEPARQKPIAVWAASDLSADASLFGATGSPTSVSEIFSVEPKRKRVIRGIDGDVTTAVRDTVRGLTGEGLFTGQKPATQSAIRPRTKGGSKQQAIWVVTEAVGETIRPATFELLGRGMELAEKIGGELAAVVIGHNTEQHAKTLAAHGADRVYIADAPALTDYSTEGYTAVLADAIRHHDPFAVLLPSTANGRDL
ncbi:MAG: hypothetical protein HY260_03840, partial [Chloroflexi bacterium]|nr:hypothetical protein [Chloroflexota bacterium]